MVCDWLKRDVVWSVIGGGCWLVASDVVWCMIGGERCCMVCDWWRELLCGV